MWNNFQKVIYFIFDKYYRHKCLDLNYINFNPILKAAVRNFFWIKMIENQYLIKHITASVQNYLLTLARFTTVSL